MRSRADCTSTIPRFGPVNKRARRQEQETRRARPLVCVADGKPYIRTFLRGALSEFSFSIYECERARDLSAALDAKPPNLVVLGLTAGGVAAGEMLQTLAANLATIMFVTSSLGLRDRDKPSRGRSLQNTHPGAYARSSLGLRGSGLLNRMRS